MEEEEDDQKLAIKIDLTVTAPNPTQLSSKFWLRTQPPSTAR
jgi:hypothetical protein